MADHEEEAHDNEGGAEPVLTYDLHVFFIPAYNGLVREAVAEASTLKYRDTEAKIVKAEYLAAIALQTGRAKDRERVIRLLEDADIDRELLARIVGLHGLGDRLKELEEKIEIIVELQKAAAGIQKGTPRRVWSPDLKFRGGVDLTVVAAGSIILLTNKMVR